MSSQAGISGGPRGQLGVGRDHAELLLARERLLAQRVPALVELALVLRRPLRRDVVRRVRRARREVDEERLVGHQRLLLADPPDRPVGHVLGEVVALLRGLVRLDRRRPFVDRRVVLVRLAADEAVEVLEAAAAARPRVERAERARLPHRHLVALAELRRRVAVELQRLRQRRARVRADRVVARRRRRDLRDPAHPDRVVVAARQQRGPRRRAQRRRVEAAELQARRRPVARPSACGTARRTRSSTRSRRRRSARSARSARPRADAAARSPGTSPPGPSRPRRPGRRTPGRGSAARPDRRWKARTSDDPLSRSRPAAGSAVPATLTGRGVRLPHPGR